MTPETDLAGVRARAALLARGWPAYLEWRPPSPVLAVLDRLCQARRDACDYEWTAVGDPEPAEVADTLLALTAGLVEAGLPSELAEHAATHTRLLDWMTVVECVRWTAQPKPPGWLRLPTPMNAETAPLSEPASHEVIGPPECKVPDDTGSADL